MKDCRRDEIWESAKRRKAMNGLSESTGSNDRRGGKDVFPESEGVVDEDVIVSCIRSMHIRSRN